MNDSIRDFLIKIMIIIMEKLYDRNKGFEKKFWWS